MVTKEDVHRQGNIPDELAERIAAAERGVFDDATEVRRSEDRRIRSTTATRRFWLTRTHDTNPH